MALTALRMKILGDETSKTQIYSKKNRKICIFVRITDEVIPQLGKHQHPRFFPHASSHSISFEQYPTKRTAKGERRRTRQDPIQTYLLLPA